MDFSPFLGTRGGGSHLQALASALGHCPFHQKAQTGVKKDEGREQGRDAHADAASGRSVVRCPGKEGGVV